MAIRRIVVIGGSSGGLEALRVITAALPSDFPAPVCVVLHAAPESPGMLAGILTRSGGLAASTATSGERLRPGRIYVAPPDHHLVVEPDAVTIARGPKENRFRPAIDPLFRSAAQVYGPGAVGIILTGNLDDGTAGLWVLKQMGGIAIVQDPHEALFPSMPQSAIRHVNVDYVVPLASIAPLVTELVTAPVSQRPVPAVPSYLAVESSIAREANAMDAGVEEIGEPSPYACPECHGVLLRLKEGNPVRFRCHTGHAYSAESLVAAVSEGIDEALWNAIRALEEGGLLMSHLAGHLKRGGDSDRARALEDQARAVHDDSERVRQIATARGALTMADVS